MDVILASASPRRKSLLSMLYSDFKIMPSDIREMVPMRLSHRAGPYLLSGILNACSFGAGLILNHIM